MQKIASSLAFCVCSLFTLAGCAPMPSKLTAASDAKPRKIAIFFDGTANDPVSDTNVKKLHSLVSLQSNPAIATFYIEGVGANGKPVGMATGWGIGERVRKAYVFLQEQYRPGDEVYIFGFSRGAYSARILSALLYYGGIPPLKDTAQGDLANELYAAYKGEQKDRRTRIKTAFRALGMADINPEPVPVKVLGLWDTVEALGWPDYTEEFDSPNDRYGDQICNVEKAYHAVSLDDDRARIFTPILMTWKHLLADCKKNENEMFTDEAARTRYLNEVVDEVYFAGAHADVGGGYPDSLLSGVSLNWMLRNLASTGLLPGPVQVRQDVFGLSHDPEGGFVWGLLYHKQHRDLAKHLSTGDVLYNGGRLKIHTSAIDRLERCAEDKCLHKEHEFPWSSWAGECFKKNGNRYTVDRSRIADCKIDIVP